MLSYREYPAPARLRRLVECLWLIQDRAARRARPVEHVIPDGCPELILHLGDPFTRRVADRWRRQPAAFLAGTLARPWQLRPGARVLTLGIRFRPAAVTRFFPLDMARAVDSEVTLDTLVDAGSASGLLESLRRVKRDTALIAAARRWLLARPLAPAPGDDLAARACRAILAGRGRRPLFAVAARLETSARRLERSFARHLGIRPKLFARIARLQAALATLDQAERGRAAEWALAAGYFDQAHLARDFRVIAGRPASRPRQRDGEMARHFSDPARLAALLTGE